MVSRGFVGHTIRRCTNEAMVGCDIETELDLFSWLYKELLLFYQEQRNLGSEGMVGYETMVGSQCSITLLSYTHCKSVTETRRPLTNS